MGMAEQVGTGGEPSNGKCEGRGGTTVNVAMTPRVGEKSANRYKDGGGWSRGGYL